MDNINNKFVLCNDNIIGNDNCHKCVFHNYDNTCKLKTKDYAGLTRREKRNMYNTCKVNRGYYYKTRVNNAIDNSDL